MSLCVNNNRTVSVWPFIAAEIKDVKNSTNDLKLELY